MAATGLLLVLIHQRKHRLVAGQTADEHNGAHAQEHVLQRQTVVTLADTDVGRGAGMVGRHDASSRLCNKCHRRIGSWLALLVSGMTKRAMVVTLRVLWQATTVSTLGVASWVTTDPRCCKSSHQRCTGSTNHNAESANDNIIVW
jgi:hypothetical protein